MNADVVSINVTPKVVKRDYKDHRVEFIFDQDRKTWSWRFIHTQHTTFAGQGCPSLDDAIKRAYKNIDIIMG